MTNNDGSSSPADQLLWRHDMCIDEDLLWESLSSTNKNNNITQTCWTDIHTDVHVQRTLFSCFSRWGFISRGGKRQSKGAGGKTNISFKMNLSSLSWTADWLEWFYFVPLFVHVCLSSSISHVFLLCACNMYPPHNPNVIYIKAKLQDIDPLCNRSRPRSDRNNFIKQHSFLFVSDSPAHTVRPFARWKMFCLRFQIFSELQVIKTLFFTILSPTYSGDKHPARQPWVSVFEAFCSWLFHC